MLSWKGKSAMWLELITGSTLNGLIIRRTLWSFQYAGIQSYTSAWYYDSSDNCHTAPVSTWNIEIVSDGVSFCFLQPPDSLYRAVSPRWDFCFAEVSSTISGIFKYLPAITVVPFSWQRVHPLFFVSSDKILYPLMETMQKYSPPTSLWGSRQTTGKVRHRQTRIAQNMWYCLGQHLQNSCNWQLWLGVCDQLLRPSPVIDYNVC